jgi:Protein of unknown function (DUF2971)
MIDELLKREHPAKLFHYTTTNGLLGIFKTGMIWASSSFHLNDSNEFRYAVGLIVERLRRRIRLENGPCNQRYGTLLDEMPDLTHSVQAYVASFSEEADLLSQWLAYSGEGNGYALGLNSAHFSCASKEGFDLVRCVYRKEDQYELADAIIDSLCEMPEEGDEETLRKVLTACVAMKHSGFKSEAEWRLVKTLFITWGKSNNVAFREGRNGLVPYLEAPLTRSGEAFVPIEIHIGPSDDMNAAELAMETFLSKHQMLHVEVSPSKTPYRP